MKRLLFILTLINLLSLNAGAQFYNGLQMDFGKNRVQYRPFLWQYYRQPAFDVYFYEGGSNLASYTAQKVTRDISEIETLLGTNLQKRIIFLMYNNLSDFRQSNIGLVTGNDQYNIGGTTQILDNKVFIYYEGDHKLLDKQIKAAVAEIILNQMLFGSDFKSRVTNSTLLVLPDWYYKGLISYLSDEWSPDVENHVRDGIMSHRFDKFNRLSGSDAIYAGHAIWHFIVKKFGKQTIPNILYLTRISKNVETGFLYTIGLPVKYLSREWLDYYTEQYEKDEAKRQMPPDTTITKKIKKNTLVRDIKLSGDEQWMAYSTNQMGRVKIYLKSLSTNKTTCIYRQGNRLDQITDYSYPIIAWHPTGKLVAFIVEKKGTKYLYTYELETGELSYKELFNVEKILDFDFSYNGFNLVMSAVRNGHTDIFIFNNAANSYEQITNDLADDRYPRFFDQSKKIVFSSNRLNNSIKCDSLQASYDLFVYSFKDNDTTLTRITSTPFADEIQPFPSSTNEFYLLSNASGLYNRYLAKYDSTISFIDTTTHYRYFTGIKAMTNFSRSMLEHSFINSGVYTELFYNNGKQYSQKQSVSTSDLTTLPETPFIKDMLKEIPDTIKSKKSVAIFDSTFLNIKIDTNKLDVNHYVFNFQLEQLKGNLKKENEKNEVSSENKFKPMIYQTSFYTNTLTSQVDFGFLSNSYQPFTGGPFYYNPGFNVFFKLGTNDLFEDYKITGGVRFAGDFNSNEYLLSFENLKNRWDKQIVFHRIALNKINNVSLLKTHTHELFYILRYPFNQVAAVRFTASYRYDRTAYLSTDILSLTHPNENAMWAGLKGEFIYDNTINKGLNLMFGTRGKVFFESYYQTNSSKITSLYVSGIDIRHYQPIHRTFIWASRLAASNSFGGAKLIYYLGGVDNWINLSTKIPTFDPSVRIDETQNYVYQAVATNLRGFPQNIRNGNSFIVLNNELRLPIVKYLMNRPIHSDFFENFQIIGFVDAGTAWSGDSPYSNKNAYNTEVVTSGPITITIDKKRDPIVWGYGFGLRSRLLGYFVRADWAWGVENNMIMPKIFYLSLSLDF
jgi:hypothetical protein